LFSQTRLGKWLWRIFHEREAFWRVVIDYKYGNAWGGWCSNEVFGLYEMGLWTNIRKVWEELSSLTSFEMGDGCKIIFLLDLWREDQVLKKAFSDLFSITRLRKL